LTVTTRFPRVSRLQKPVSGSASGTRSGSPACESPQQPSSGVPPGSSRCCARVSDAPFGRSRTVDLLLREPGPSARKPWNSS
jgi:hypothetical protein